jgi:hypothetical protein
MKAIIKEIPKQTKAFFSTFPWRNLLLFSVFLIVAFVFWVMLFFRKENVEVSHIIPIVYVNVPDDEVFRTSPPDFIEVSFRDAGSNIFWNSFSRRDTLVVDVASFQERGIVNLQHTDMQFLFTEIFPNGHTFGWNPISISLETVQLQSKELAVVFGGEITTNRANLLVDTLLFTPETVVAFGSKEAIEELQAAITEFRLFRNLRTSKQSTMRIDPIEGVRFMPDEVDVFISVEEFTERSIDVPIMAMNVPEHLGVKFFPSRVTVSFSVTLEEYRNISADDLEIVLDYYDFFDKENGRIPLQLTTQPASIINTRLSPSSVEFLFESRVTE